MFVVITTLDPRYWDDGPESVYGPFSTEEKANAFAVQTHIGGSVWPLIAPPRDLSLLDTRIISENGFSTRLVNGCHLFWIYEDGKYIEAPIKTVGELLSYSPYQFMRQPNIGMKTIREFVAWCDEHFLDLTNWPQWNSRQYRSPDHGAV